MENNKKEKAGHPIMPGLISHGKKRDIKRRNLCPFVQFTYCPMSLRKPAGAQDIFHF
jgi:hypothetical protein